MTLHAPRPTPCNDPFTHTQLPLPLLTAPLLFLFSSADCTSQGSFACATDDIVCTTGADVTTLACAAPAFGYSVDSNGFAQWMYV